MLIKDILTIDLSQDIKNVIDLEDISENEIQSEIENYIITDGLAKEYANFVSIFTSNIVETGVWISGFYGSGKSYFGKLLGYMLSNRNILGTPARDRILQRFTGIKDEALVKNSIAKLNSENCRVVFLDVAKQDTKKGLAYTLFRNFLKSLELPENEHGFLLYQLMMHDKQVAIHSFISDNLNQNWGDLKSRLIAYAKATKAIYIGKGHNEKDYEMVMETIRRDIDQFSPARLKEELNNYLQIAKREKIVFLFDEASEAINQRKINLLDLEGISESLSTLGGKVWTIAIAQEKLDDIIKSASIDKAQLTKVTDRFKTKIHLEATEVDVIIRSRLLKKKPDALQKLKDHYQKNSGKINDHAGLNATGIPKTNSEDTFVTYYPFYKYQFDLLQNFLFGTKGYASTKVAARGMIITTYDILKRGLDTNQLFDTATGWQIASEAQRQPDVRLVNRYDNADKILRGISSTIAGRHLLETINFLHEAEVVPTTLNNIVKSYTKEPDNLHKVQADIAEALDVLAEAKILLNTNNTYRITSDIEQRLLDEMKNYSIQGFVKKKRIVGIYKASPTISHLARVTDNGLMYQFLITTDNDEELTNPSLKQLKIKVKNIYNIENRTAETDALKTKHQNDKDLIWLMPDNDVFKEVDKLVVEIEQTTYLEQKYTNPQSEEGKILMAFSTAKSEKESRLKELIEQSLQKATAIYLYNTLELNKDTWQNILQSQQRQMIQNVFSRRLEAQLGDAVAASVIKEANNARLKSYFTTKDFQFFDASGNFIGDNLKVVEEIIFKIRNTFVDGLTLQNELEQPPTGFHFGTVISTVAALMRAGKIMAKYNGAEKFSWRDEGVKDIFAAAREFRKTSFKAIAKQLSASQKGDLVAALQDLNVEDHIKKKIDWNTNDFDLVAAVRELAKNLCDKVDFMRKQNRDFDALFADIEAHKDRLAAFTGAVSEGNYIDKAEQFLAHKDAFNEAVNAIEKVEKFMRNNLPKLLTWKEFVENVNDELTKSANSNADIDQLTADFKAKYAKEVVKNFAAIQQTTQKIKDVYFNLMQTAATKMAAKYTELSQYTEGVLSEINTLPIGLNNAATDKTKAVLQYAAQRTRATVEIDFEVKDKNTRFTYSEILSFIDLVNSKKTDVDILKAGLIRTEPPKPDPSVPTPTPTTRTFTTQLPHQKLKVKAYKMWLQQELQKLASANDEDNVEIN